jgi:hypothetical protein
LVRVALGGSFFLPQASPPDTHEDLWDLEPYYDEQKASLDIPKADFVDATGKPLLQQLFTDTLINAEVLLQAGNSAAIARVMQRCVDVEGRVVGDYNANPLLNTIMYECKFGNGTTKAYAINTIATNITWSLMLMDIKNLLFYHIIDHKQSGDVTLMEDK